MATLKTITSANSQLSISVPGLFDSPVPIQGYAADAAFMNDVIQAAEVTMGVDGYMSAGYIPKEVKLKISLSPDSPSKSFFDAWYNAMTSAREVSFGNAVINLPSVQESYTFTRGVMTSYAGIPPGKKKLDPVEYELTFQSISKATL